MIYKKPFQIKTIPLIKFILNDNYFKIILFILNYTILYIKHFYKITDKMFPNTYILGNACKSK